jgi:hypothetical protein
MTTFDSSSFERDLRRAAEQVANDGMEELASKLQRLFDDLLRSSGGKPVDEIKAALAASCKREDFSLDEEDLTTYSTAISEGTRIVVQPERVRLQ